MKRLGSEADRLPPGAWWLLAGLTAAWGFNWTAMKVSLEDVSPWTFRALCLGLGSAVLFAVMRAGGHALSVPKGQWARLALLAFFNITLWNILVAFGLMLLPSGRAAILAYTMPLWAIPLSIWWLGERFTARKGLALALGTAGLVLLLADSFSTLAAAPLGSLLTVGAAASWGIGSVLQKRYPMAMSAGPYTAWMMLIGGVPIFAGALIFDEVEVLRHIGIWASLGIAYNVFIAFAWAYWAWIKLATAVPVTVFSLSMLVIPAIGVLSGMLFLGERPTWMEYGALVLILAALAALAARR